MERFYYEIYSLIIWTWLLVSFIVFVIKLIKAIKQHKSIRFIVYIGNGIDLSSFGKLLSKEFGNTT